MSRPNKAFCFMPGASHHRRYDSMSKSKLPIAKLLKVTCEVKLSVIENHASCRTDILSTTQQNVDPIGLLFFTID
jgi:hypothetical protein